MKNIFFFILTVIFFAISMQGQQTVDSLLTVLENKSISDSTRINLLVEVSKRYRQTDFKKGVFYSKEALKLARTVKDTQNLFISLINMGAAYRFKAQRDSSLLYIQEAADLALSQNNKTNRVLANSELLALYQDARYLEEALNISLDNIALVKDDPPNPQKGKLYYDLGNVYRRQNKFAQAVQTYEKGIAICEEANFKHGEMLIRATMAQAYIGLEEFDKSEQNLTKTLQYFQEKNQTSNIAACHLDLGKMFAAKGEHHKAVPNFLTAKEFFEKVNREALLKDIYQKLFISYSILGQQDSATAANKRYNILKDSLDSRERKALVAETKTKYETEKIEAQKNAAQAESALARANSKVKNYLLAGLVLLLVISGLAYRSYIKKIKIQKKAELTAVALKQAQQQLALEKQYRDSELKALKAQMNPHFIFNSLNSIQEYVVLNKKEEASSYLQRFASLIRSYLDFSEAGYNSMRDEVESLTSYLELEKLRFEESFHYTLDVDPDVSTSWEIPTMLVQPFVENALVHGLLHKKENRELQIRFSNGDSRQVICVITDNGVGRKYTQELKKKFHDSFATKATVNRLDLLNYRRDKKIGVEITDLFDGAGSASGTKVTITIPLVKQTL